MLKWCGLQYKCISFIFTHIVVNLFIDLSFAGCKHFISLTSTEKCKSSAPKPLGVSIQTGDLCLSVAKSTVRMWHVWEEVFKDFVSGGRNRY